MNQANRRGVVGGKGKGVQQLRGNHRHGQIGQAGHHAKAQHGHQQPPAQQLYQRAAPQQARHPPERGNLCQHAQRPQPANLAGLPAVSLQANRVKRIVRTMRHRHQHGDGVHPPHLRAAQGVAEWAMAVPGRWGRAIRQAPGKQRQAGERGQHHPGQLRHRHEFQQIPRQQAEQHKADGPPQPHPRIRPW